MSNCNKDLCYNTSNNKYFGCPPRMSDGRNFTDYRGNCYLNNLIRENNQTYNSFQYRMFLARNAEKMMQMNRANACQKNCCGPCKKPYESGTMLPENTKYSCNTSSCSKISEVNPMGIGISYSNEPLSCPNWKNLKAYSTVRKNCCTPMDSNFDYYPVSQSSFESSRLTVPGGGIPLSGGDPNYYS